MESLLREPFRRFDESPDAFFYRQPRFVTHIDEPAVAAVTRLYREVLPAGGAVLDLMSSWVSHLPPEVVYRRVVGLGMNEDELAANPRLDPYHVQDLNRETLLAWRTNQKSLRRCPRGEAARRCRPVAPPPGDLCWLLALRAAGATAPVLRLLRLLAG